MEALIAAIKIDLPSPPERIYFGKIGYLCSKLQTMTALQQVEKLLPTMSPKTKARLFQKIAGMSSDLYPGIEKTPGVCGGSACIIRTRIPVWSLVAWKKLGATDEQLLKSYPSLIQQDLNNAWGYYLIHTEEIDTEIKENDEA